MEGGMTNTLDDLFTQRIVALAHGEGNTDLQAKDVTPEWIVEQRERRVYPSARFKFPSTPGLKYPTRKEVDAVLQWADAWLRCVRSLV